MRDSVRGTLYEKVRRSTQRERIPGTRAGPGAPPLYQRQMPRLPHLKLSALLALVVCIGTSTAATPQEGASLTQDLRWRNIGPANMTGRIASIDALETDHRTVLVASASGGVFLSHNAGLTWKPIFDNADGAGSIGAAVLFQADPDVIWVGTGEAANRNSSGWGDGVWRTTDGGDTWDHLGLADTHHIAEIALHPTDPDVAYVASPGHLWGYDGDRGLFKTVNGGASWTRLGGGLPEDSKTGCTEIIMQPGNPEVLYAGFYHRLRQPATMVSGGEQGGLYKSTDGGATWRQLTNGLPAATGMIDVAIRHGDPRMVVAAIEADQNIAFDGDRHASENPPGPGIYISRDAGETWTYALRTNVRPFYHGQVEVDPTDPDRIYSVGREFKVTKDGGETWIDRWWGGGGDDHDLWIAPDDGSVRYMATDQGAYLTVDDGETVLGFNNMAIGQYYKIGVDMRDPYWVIGGLQDNAIWQGPSNSREVRGILNLHNTWLAEGDGSASWVDPTDWRTAYAVNHVGFAARLNVETRDHTYITPTPETVVNFDDYADPEYDEEPIDYTIDPGEHWFFRERPERPLLPPQFRFNWNSPLLISPSNPHTIYFAGNHLFKSVDRGDSWRIISPDLSTNDETLRNPSSQGGMTRSVTGGENHFTIFAIDESPLDPALVWAGTDDGNVQLTRDAGISWRNVRDAIPGIPSKIWVASIRASHHAACRAFVALDNHRRDDFRAYVYRTDDCGASWADISATLPNDGSTYVIVEDPVNPDLLFVGTEFAVFTSVDAGRSWTRLVNNLPRVAARDLLVHPRDGDLVVGTHGRAIWILDDISPLRQTTAEVTASAAWLYEPRRATRWARINLGRKQPDFLFRGENPPYGALLHFWLREAPGDGATLRVEEILGDRQQTIDVEAKAGLNRARWDLSFSPTDADRRNFRDHLREVLRTLASRVDTSALQRQLDALSGRLDAIDLASDDVDRDLNAVRGAFVGGFAMYAGGRPLFGDKIGPNEAQPGTYRVVLEVGDRTLERRLVVRDDPLRH